MERHWDLPGFTIRLVPTTGYFKNISIGRVRFEVIMPRIYTSVPLSQCGQIALLAATRRKSLGWISVRLAKKFRVPLVLDVFDLWPELFVLALPRLLQPAAPVVFSPLYWLRRHNLNQATAITALSETYLQVAKEQAPSVTSALCQTIFNGINVSAFREAAKVASTPISGVNIMKQPGEIWVVYAGSLGNNYDIRTLLLAALELEEHCNPIRLWIAGDGPLRVDVTNFIERTSSDAARLPRKG